MNTPNLEEDDIDPADRVEVIPELNNTFRPLRDMVLALYNDMKKKQGDIYIPPTKKIANQVFHDAKVVACGVKCEHTKVGNTIRVGEHHGDFYNIAGKRHVLIREKDIVGIYNNIQT